MSARIWTLLRVTWNVLLFGAVTLSAIVIPARLVIAPRPFSLSDLLDWGLTIVLLTDLVIRFLSTVTLRHRERSDNQQPTLTAIQVGGLVLDGVAAIPWGRLFGWPVLDLLRLVKLVRLGPMLRTQHHGGVLHSTVIRLGSFLFWLGLAAHWLACGWLALKSAGESRGTYLEALYWCITTLTTVGYGDVTPTTQAQTIYTMATMILGVGIYGYVIGNVANLLTKLDLVKANYQSTLERLAGFMRYRKIPPPMQQRIFDYYAYLWDNRMGYDEAMVLADLPPTLQAELSLLLKRDVIRAVPFLQDAPQALIRDLCMQLRPVVFTPRDVIFHAGEVGRHMYFIGSGTVEIRAADGETVYETLSAGDFFGEIALLHERPRSAMAIAIDYCDLYVLDKDAFDRVAVRYPNFAAHVYEVATARWQRGRPVIQIRYACAEQTVLVDDPDLTLLEISINHKILHMRECGGSALCTTCRVRILDGMAHLTPRTPAEASLAQARGWGASIRLACQTKVTGTVTLERVVQDSAEVSHLQLETVPSIAGCNRPLAVLCCAIRTSHESEAPSAPEFLSRLRPLLTSLGEPILMNNGLVYQYSGAGFTGVFGVGGDTRPQSCQSAVRSALGMANLLSHLAGRLGIPDSENLTLSIGVHCGDVHIDHVGPANQQQMVLLGETVTVAQQIETMNDRSGTTVLISEDVLTQLPPDSLATGDSTTMAQNDQRDPITVFEIRRFNNSDSLLIVQETLGILLQDEAQFAQDFYCRLFNRAPDVEQLFQGNLEAQGKMLTQMLKGALYALSRPQHLARGLEQLGRQHVIYGVNTAHYAVFQEALLATIEDRLDGAYTPEVARAWEATINTILGLMQRGGETAPPGAPEESSLPNVESPLW